MANTIVFNDTCGCFSPRYRYLYQLNIENKHPKTNSMMYWKWQIWFKKFNSEINELLKKKDIKSIING